MMRARGIIVPLILLAIWQLFSLQGIKSDTLAAPITIIVALFHAIFSTSLWSDTAETLIAAGVGLFLGGGLGLVAGAIFGVIPPVGKLMWLTIEFLRPLPAIAIVPLAILTLGFGYAMEISIVAFATFFPVLILTQAAVHQVEPRLMEVAQVMRLSPMARMTKIIVPAVLPSVFIALRLAAGLALIVAITVEISANPMGLGSRIMQAGQSLRPAEMFAGLIWIGLLGWAVNLGLMRLENRLFSARTGGQS